MFESYRLRVEKEKLRLLYLIIDDMKNPVNLASTHRQIADQLELIYKLI